MDAKPEEPAGTEEQESTDARSPQTRLKKPVKPDVEEHKAAVEQLQLEMNRRRARIDEIKQTIEQKKSAGAGPEVQQARTKLNQLSSSFRAELDKKKAMREELNAVNKGRETLRAKLRDLKGKVGANATIQKIEEKIAALDYRITHHTLDLKEENRMRDEMKKLAALKPTVASYLQEQENLKGSDGAREQVMTRLKACDETLTAIKAEEEQQRSYVDELRKKDAAKSQDVPALAKERDECREVMNALWQKIQEMREEHRARHNVYWEEQQAWQKQHQEERRQKQLAWEKEKAEKDAARRAAAAEYAGEPYHKEVSLCEQLISHLGKYRHQAEAQTSTSAPATAVGADSVFEGMKPAKKKGEGEDQEFGAFFGTSSAKKGKGKRSKAAGSAQAAPADQKLNHSLDMINAFTTLKVSMPATASRVHDALREVEERRAYWLKKRADAKESGIVAGEEPPEASSSAARATANGVAKPKANGALDLTAEEWPDFAGNVAKAPAALGAAGKGVPAPDKSHAGSGSSGRVAVRLEVAEGDTVSLTCTEL